MRVCAVYSKPVVRNIKAYVVAEDVFIQGYVWGEDAGPHTAISPAELMAPQTENSEFMRELYDGRRGCCIWYNIGNMGIEEARQQIHNPHSITGNWAACIRGSFADQETTMRYDAGMPHFPNALAYARLYRNFFSALCSGGARMSAGPYNVVPQCHNMVTWEVCIFCLFGFWCLTAVSQTQYSSGNVNVVASDALPEYYRGTCVVCVLERYSTVRRSEGGVQWDGDVPVCGAGAGWPNYAYRDYELIAFKRLSKLGL
jgi:hypothetical protein